MARDAQRCCPDLVALAGTTDDDAVSFAVWSSETLALYGHLSGWTRGIKTMNGMLARMLMKLAFSQDKESDDMGKVLAAALPNPLAGSVRLIS